MIRKEINFLVCRLMFRVLILMYLYILRMLMAKLLDGDASRLNQLLVLPLLQVGCLIRDRMLRIAQLNMTRISTQFMHEWYEAIIMEENS